MSKEKENKPIEYVKYQQGDVVMFKLNDEDFKRYDNRNKAGDGYAISTYDGNTPTTRIYRVISGGTSSAPLVATGAGNKSAGMTIEPGYAAPGTEKVGSTGMHFLDSPNTTSEITYTIQWYGREDTTGFWNYYNRQEAGNDHSYYGRAVTTLTVIEIKG